MLYRLISNLIGYVTPFSISEQAFINWLAMRDALTTERKLLILGFQGDVKCIFL
jgi:hypothetical protein